ncbi:hypothetical protein [Nodosilinea nodulosa]|uniref:hypothetical protein n=1 Tax=Nodosilinea nodulosa TaxID=416001 RepID=UPI00030336B1|nr:hypothetical protein [Nodosilinea nodulosa]
MVLNLAKSPLAWSIGGVGAIAIALIGLSYLRQGSASVPESEPAPSHSLASPWQQGTDLGWQAAVAAQTAQTKVDWQRVADLWGQAIAALERIPTDAPNYAEAQAKAQDYRGNRAIASDRQAKANSTPKPPTASDLQTALAASESAFTFTPGPANRTVGHSADGLATVELTGDRATLVLPRRANSTSLTMAQVVYASQFLALTAPEAAAQPWLLEGLRAAQSDRPRPLPASAPITLSTDPEALSISVVTEP